MNRDLRNALADLFAKVTGWQVRWDNAPEDFISPSPGCLLELSTFGMRKLGCDELRRTTLASPARITEDVVGQRIATLALRLDVYDSDLEALDLLDDLVSATHFERVRALFTELSMAVADIGEIRDLRTVKDTRVISSASVDLRVSWAKRRSDREVVPTWIETVESEWVDP